MGHQSFILAFSTMILVSGCQFSAPGERAFLNEQCPTQPCEVVCPSGETCSPDTPNGLFFRGASLFDDIFGGDLRATAEGGTQGFFVHRNSSGTQAFAPFDAEASAPLEITEAAPPRVTLRGNVEGSGFLRILDPETGALHDRIELAVAPIGSARFVGGGMPFLDPEAEHLDLALLKDAGVFLGLMLRDANGMRLVDESTSITITGDAKDDADTSTWDQRFVTVGASGTVSASVVTGDGKPFEVMMPIVDKLDDIVAVKSLLSLDITQPIPVGSGHIVCFRGLFGGRVVAGLSEWKMSGEGPIEVKYATESCGDVKAITAGNAKIVVEIGGMKKSFPVTMAKAAKAGAAPAEKASGEAFVGLTPGERARR